MPENKQATLEQLHRDMPIEVLMMPEILGMPYWARMTHQLMLNLNPQRLTQMAAEGTLSKFLSKQQERMTALSAQEQRDWKLSNPLPPEADHYQRVSWNRHAILAAREILLAQMESELAAPMMLEAH